MSLPEGLTDYVSILEYFGAYEVSDMELYGDVFKLGTGFLTKAGEHRDGHEFNGNPIILGSFDEKIRREMVFEDTFEEQLLWLASFDEYRDEGGAMNAWLKLALAKSESVLSGDVIDDFTPYGG